MNGYVRKQIRMNSGTNAMGPHNEVNSVIGRTFKLMFKTASGLHRGVPNLSGLGSTIQYNNLCFAES